MKQQKILLLLLVIIAILLLSIAYAIISNVKLDIDANAVGTPNEANFKVAFNRTPRIKVIKNATIKEHSISARVEVTSDTTAILEVSGFRTIGDKVTAILTIENTSEDITAILSKTDSNTNSDYFSVKSTLESTEIEPKDGATTLTIEIELIKEPTSLEQANIGVEVIAIPRQ